MSSIEDRIAAVLQKARLDWDPRRVFSPEFDSFAARAVVAELGLTQERGRQLAGSVEPCMWGTLVRVVGAWRKEQRDVVV